MAVIITVAGHRGGGVIDRGPMLTDRDLLALRLRRLREERAQALARAPWGAASTVHRVKLPAEPFFRYAPE